MSESDRLRRVFRQLHEDDPRPPSYRSLSVSPGTPAGTARRTSPAMRAAWALAAAAAAMAVVLVLRAGSPLHPGTPAAITEEETLQLAASIGNWEAPTDFLLSTPGREFLQSAPLLGTGTDTLSGDRTDLLQNDSNANEPDENDMEVYE